MRVAFYTLGCKVNTYETNVIKDLFKDRGYNIEQSEADIYIINTCTVTSIADRKSRQLIHRIIRENPNAIIVAMGCMVQVNSNKLEDLDIDILIGSTEKSKVVDYVEKYIEDKKKQNNITDLENAPFDNMNAVTFGKQTRAFVKIQDGCENFCSYCIIPFSRGPVRSKLKEDVINEITSLVNNDYKEIVLTGIHIGQYGKDLEDYNLYNLLVDILKIEGLERLRISSIEINEISDEIIKLIKDNKKIARHLHIPLQSGSDETLKDMNRKYDTIFYKKRINKIRNEIENVSITTDLIVGFPTETERCFNDTCNFLEEIKFSKIHVFPFSLRNGTKAEKFKNVVSDLDKKERVKKVIEINKKLEFEYMNMFLNKKLSVIFEKEKNDYFLGHSDNYLNIKSFDKFIINEIVDVKVAKIEYPYCIVEKW